MSEELRGAKGSLLEERAHLEEIVKVMSCGAKARAMRLADAARLLMERFDALERAATVSRGAMCDRRMTFVEGSGTCSACTFSLAMRSMIWQASTICSCRC